MARKILLETAYTFTPSANTVVIPKTILRERLLLITNVTSNQVIYNFSDPSLKATSYITNTDSSANESTTIVLSYNTTAMLSTDKLSFTIDEYAEKFEPAETLMDPTNKLRVSTPQSLIDTDFEYGTQISKWENLALYNNRPFSYTSPTQIANISSIAMPTNSRTVTVTLASGAAPANNTPIVVQDTYLQAANGNFIIESGGGGSSFTYTAAAINTTAVTAIFDPNKTIVATGSLFTGAQIGGTPTLSYSGRKITVVTTTPHGLALGNEIVVIGSTASTNAPNGNMEVAQINSSTSFSYYVDNAPTGTLAAGSIYVRPQASFAHRPADGGVIFGTNAGSNYASAIRQTRRYFRYQSGKGIQFSSGTILKPYAGIDSITWDGSVVTVQTKEKHNIQPGTVIKIGGCDQYQFNGTYTITSIISFDKFQYTPTASPTTSIATGSFYASVEGWTGCQNRLGGFDNQNGLFFEYDGKTLYAVRRNSTFQASGRVSVTNGGSVVSQTAATFPTYFARQFAPGDFIVIRGQSYKIQDIASNTSMTITPAYRGATTDYAILSKTQETRIPQSSFNIDRLDGTGPSQYNIDLGKMQMFYIDYTWYGAGFVRWGVRGPKGNVIYVHKMPNNNLNTEAYMRSGNLPGRYESTTTPPYTFTKADVLTTDSALSVADTSRFPDQGTLVIRNATTYEYVNYTAKTQSTGIYTTTATGLGGVGTLVVGSNTGLAVGMTASGTGIGYGATITNINGTVITVSVANTSAVNGNVTFSGGATSGTFTGLTRGRAGEASVSLTIAAGANGATGVTTTNLQVGMRVISSAFPEGTYISAISGSFVIFSNAALSANPTGVIFAPMGATSPQLFTYSDNAPTCVELAFPTFSASISHWGTSVIMDGRFDDDKSLVFTYGQRVATALAPSQNITTTITGTSGANTIVVGSGTNLVAGMSVTGTGIGAGAVVTIVNGTGITLSVNNSGTVSGNGTFSGGNSKALFSIRVAPSVDNGIAAAFGARELVNRMQLTLRALDVTTSTAGANLLVTAVLNGLPSTANTWTNAVGNAAGAVNSSLAQIADYAGGTTTVSGGEVTAGFFLGTGANSIDLSGVRDLGNSILGGGGTAANTNIYPDGPDVLTVTISNLGTTSASVFGRLSWTEAQA